MVKTRVILMLALLGPMLMALPALGVFGNTELVMVPSADTLRTQQFELGFHAMTDGPWFGEFHLGIAPGFEVGVDAIEDNDLGLRLKYRFLEETKDTPALAVGINDVGRDDVSPYIVASMRFPKTFIRWHLGLGGGWYDGLFLGLSTDLNTISSGKKGTPISLMLEVVNGDLNAGAGINFAPGWKLDVGIVSQELLLGLTYQNSFK